MSRFTLSKPILTEEVERPVAQPVRAPQSPKVAVRSIPDEDDVDESDSGSQQETPVHAVPVAPMPVQRKIKNEEDFWTYVEKMAWRDRSEDPNFSVSQKKLNYKAISIPDQEAFADYLTHVVATMDERLQAANCYGNVTDVDERKAICSHIVGRGSIFYAMTMEDPGFASYLIPENTEHREYYDMMELIRI